MSTLLDTNILTRSAQPHHPMHQAAVDAVSDLRQQQEQLYLIPQNLYEFWVVATRPLGENGLGLTVAQAQSEIGRLKQLFLFADDTSAIFSVWETLIAQYQVIGKSGHDARLVAAMKVHAIGKILTFNERDFQRYQGIVVLSPYGVLKKDSP